MKHKTSQKKDNSQKERICKNFIEAETKALETSDLSTAIRGLDLILPKKTRVFGHIRFQHIHDSLPTSI